MSDAVIFCIKNRRERYRVRDDVVAEEGFEPSQTESESVVLPLHNSALFLSTLNIIIQTTEFVKSFFNFFCIVVLARHS